jgi:hypothetical protein
LLEKSKNRTLELLSDFYFQDIQSNTLFSKADQLPTQGPCQINVCPEMDNPIQGRVVADALLN